MSYKAGDFVIFIDAAYVKIGGPKLRVGGVYEITKCNINTADSKLTLLQLKNAVGVYAHRVIPFHNISKLEKIIYGVE